METEKQNWKDDFMTNESLHANSQAISALYSRLRIKHPLHKDFDLWGRESIYWADYNATIYTLELNEDIAGLEVERVAKILRQANLLEDSLSQ
jgi:hypothetical protein